MSPRELPASNPSPNPRRSWRRWFRRGIIGSAIALAEFVRALSRKATWRVSSRLRPKEWRVTEQKKPSSLGNFEILEERASPSEGWLSFGMPLIAANLDTIGFTGEQPPSEQPSLVSWLGTSDTNASQPNYPAFLTE